MLNTDESIKYAKKMAQELAKKEKQALRIDNKNKRKKKQRTVTINGEKYIKNLETGKLYGMPRIVTTRKIARNRMRNLMKSQGVTKINKNLASFWASEECRRIAYGEVAK